MNLVAKINQARDRLRMQEAQRKGLATFIDTKGNLRAARPIQFGEPIVLPAEQLEALR